MSSYLEDNTSSSIDLKSSSSSSLSAAASHPLHPHLHPHHHHHHQLFRPELLRFNNFPCSSTSSTTNTSSNLNTSISNSSSSNSSSNLHDSSSSSLASSDLILSNFQNSSLLTNTTTNASANNYFKYQANRCESSSNSIYADYNHHASSSPSFYPSPNFVSGCFEPNSLTNHMSSGFIPPPSSSPTNTTSSYLTNVGIHFASTAASATNNPSSPTFNTAAAAAAYENSNQLRIKLFQHFSGGGAPTNDIKQSPSSFTSSQPTTELNSMIDNVTNTPQSSQLHVKCTDDSSSVSKHIMAPSVYGLGLGMGMMKKAKKSRVLFSQWQINELEKLFKKQKYVTSNERELMAKRLKLQANQVKIWFQNRRYKIKKQSECQNKE